MRNSCLHGVVCEETAEQLRHMEGNINSNPALVLGHSQETIHHSCDLADSTSVDPEWAKLHHGPSSCCYCSCCDEHATKTI